VTDGPLVRAAGALIEDGRILLLRQRVSRSSRRSWSLPGGKLDSGETVADCLVREMREETGLDVRVGRLLYVADRFHDNRHLVHLTFEVSRAGGELGPAPGVQDTNPIEAVEFVPLNELVDRGFREAFQRLAQDGFPSAGSYVGAVENIGL
jgi:mutator protein MutT